VIDGFMDWVVDDSSYHANLLQPASQDTLPDEMARLERRLSVRCDYWKRQSTAFRDGGLSADDLWALLRGEHRQPAG
jgi:hypothetical protein